MLLSLIKILVFVAVVAGLTWGAARLTDVTGGAEIAMAGYEVTLGPLQLVLAIALLALLGWLLFKALGFLLALVHFINGDDTAVSRWSRAAAPSATCAAPRSPRSSWHRAPN